MKIFIFIALALLLAPALKAQPLLELDSAEVVNLNLMLDTLDYFRELIKQDSIELKKADSIIAIKQAKVENLQEQISSYKQLRALTDNKPDEAPPLLKWDGFFAGLGAGIVFDSAIVRSSLLGRVFDNLYIWAAPRVLIGLKFVFEGILKIPFKEKPFIGAALGYKFF